MTTHVETKPTVREAPAGRRRLRFAWGPLIALYSAITFFMLGIDMALLHLGYQHYSFIALMPVIFCGVATIVSVATAFSGWLRREAWVLGVLALIIGGIGTVIHLEIAFAHHGAWTLRILLERLVFDPRPPLAPAALAGTGLLLIMIAIAERWPVRIIEHWILVLARYWPVRRWVAPDASMPADDELRG